ncbi:MAG TPA: ABC transporter substrate-binding protein [Micromonosporaceae bacterium]|nr:ABC transporter substrate-binding protein [Micromonosporaceae bacterium]
MPGLARRRALAAAALALAAPLAGCAGADGDQRQQLAALPQVELDPALAARVPAAVKADGKIVVAVDPAYPPAEFFDGDGRTVVGFDVDLFSAVAAKLGLSAEYRPARFDSIIAGVGAGRYEAGVSSITVSPARKQQALMVSYFRAGTQWAVRTGNPTGLDLKNPCGAKVAVQAATVPEGDVVGRSRLCGEAKKPTITVHPYPSQEEVTEAVVSGKDDALLADSAITAHAVKRSEGALQLLAGVYNAVPYGYVVAKTQQPLAEALRDALKALIAEGTYAELLTRWGVENGAIKDPAINPNA